MVVIISKMKRYDWLKFEIITTEITLKSTYKTGLRRCVESESKKLIKWDSDLPVRWTALWELQTNMIIATFVGPPRQ